MIIAENGNARCRISVPEKPTPCELHAAKELKKYLGKISGAKFEIAAAIPAEGPAIVVAEIGHTPLAGTRTMACESIMRTINNNRLFLVGADARGTLIGIYAFLRDVLGCIFPQPYPCDEYIPHKSTIDVPETDYYHEPFLKLRYLLGGGDIPVLDWCAKAGMSFSGSPFQDKTPEFAGERPILTDETARIWHKESVILRGEPGISVGGHACEAIMPPSKYFEAHPEYFAYNPAQQPNALHRMKNGRDSYGICWTNPDVRRIFVEYFLEFFEKYPFVRRFTFFPNDGQPPCFCENCRKVEEPWKGKTTGENLQYTTNYVLFAAEIARAVAKKFPHARIEVGSYSSHTELPDDFNEELPANLDVLFCIFERKWDRALDDPPTDEELRHTLSETPIGSYEKDAHKYTVYPAIFSHWRKHIKGEFRYYDYLTSTLGSAGMLFPVSRAAVRTIRYLATLGFSGYGSQWFNAPLIWASYGLSLYVTARAMWDKEATWEDLAKEYCRGFYEEAGEHMFLYFKTLEDSAHNVRFGMGIPEILQIFDPETCRTCRNALAEAKSSTASAKVKRRIRNQEDLLEFGRLFWETRRLEKEIETAIKENRIDETFLLLAEHAKVDDRIQKLFNRPLLRWCKKWRGIVYRHILGAQADGRGLLRAVKLIKDATNAQFNNLWYDEGEKF